MHRYGFRRAQAEDLCKISRVADHFFDSNYWENGITGRCEYFKRLWAANDKIFYVLEHHHWSRSEIVGYTSIIPETRDTYKSHLGRDLNQYSLDSHQIYSSTATIPKAEFFWQAVAVYSDHLKDSKNQRDEMIAHHIADLLVNCRSQKSFSFIAERFSDGGQRFMRNRGFLGTTVNSATGHEIFTFDSKSEFIHASNLFKKGKLMVDQVTAIASDFDLKRSKL